MTHPKPFALLLALIAIHLAITLRHYERPVITDEFYYVAKARYIAEHHSFAPIDSHAIAVEQGRAFGTSDWRPAGYPLFLAALSLGDFTNPARGLRLRVTIAQFLIVSTCLIALFRIAMQSGVHGPWRYGAAIILGLPPWAFAFVDDIGPDVVNLGLVTLALLLYWRARFVLATLVASLCLFFRPEMIVLPPLMAAVALVLHWRMTRLRPRSVILPAVAAALIWCSMAGLQFVYHTWQTGQPGVFGGLHIVNGGAFAWVRTWPGSEKEGYDFVYAVTEARPASLPERAFDSPQERTRVLGLVREIERRGHFTREDDAAFARLAEEKRRAHPLRVQLLRGWHAVNMWINRENNSPLLAELAPVPSSIRRPGYGALFALRVIILLLATATLIHTLRVFRRRTMDEYDALALLMLSYAILRTVLIGIVLNWNVHRYVLSAWPPVLWAACFALGLISGRSRSSVRPEPEG